MSQKRVVIGPDPVSLTAAVASRFLQQVIRGLAERESVHVVLTGGTTSAAVQRAAGVLPARRDIDWSRVHFWWSDERFVPRDSNERNEKTARASLLDGLGIPSGNIHAIACSDDTSLDEGAAAYTAELERFGQDGHPWPTFDICFLGVGPDAHIASLFPDRPEIQVTDRAVAAVHDAPVPPARRITLTRPVLNSSREVWLVLTGADKAPALGLALAGASYDSVPAAGAKGHDQTILFIDRAAAADVPAELIDQEL